MIRRLALVLTLASPVHAQTLGLTGEDGDPVPDLSGEEVIEGGITTEVLEIGPISTTLGATQVISAKAAPSAILRGLDKVAGATTDIDLGVGEDARYGTLTVALDECRVPADNPTGDAYAHLTIRADGAEAPVFDGWMIASSPALSALDHPRYDVWIIRCNIR